MRTKMSKGDRIVDVPAWIGCNCRTAPRSMKTIANERDAQETIRRLKDKP